MAGLRSGVTPLLPVAHPHPPTQPFIGFWNRPARPGNAEVAHPSAQRLPELLEPVCYRHRPASPRQFAEAALAVVEGGIFRATRAIRRLLPKRGLIYSTRVKMAKSSILVDGTEVNRSPGMAVSVDITTGRRRVSEHFLLSPLI